MRAEKAILFWMDWYNISPRKIICLASLYFVVNRREIQDMTMKTAMTGTVGDILI